MVSAFNIIGVFIFFIGFLFENVTTDLEMVFCACDEQLQNGVDQGSDGVLSLQEFSNQVCQVWI